MFQEWDRAAAEGRSFFTTGPLLWLTAGDHQPGDTLALPADGSDIALRIRMQSPVVSVEELQLIEGGVIRERLKLTPDTNERHQHQREAMLWEPRLPLQRSTWVAGRALARSPGGRENAEAHTNPLYVKVGDTSPLRRASAEWLLKKLDERIAVNAARTFDAAGKNESLSQFRLDFRLISVVWAAQVPWRRLSAAVERRLVSKPPFHSLSPRRPAFSAGRWPIEETLFYGQRGKAGGRCAHGKRRHSSAGSHVGAAFLPAAGKADQAASARLLRSGHGSRRDR
jgi:hypothetical protein